MARKLNRCSCKIKHLEDANFCHMCGRRIPEYQIPKEKVLQAIAETKEFGIAKCLKIRQVHHSDDQRAKVYDYIEGQNKPIIGAILVNGEWVPKDWYITGSSVYKRNKSVGHWDLLEV